MQEKIKVMKKNKFRIRRIRFYSAKVTSIQKSPQITHITHEDSSQSPYPYHTHTHGIPHGNPHTHGSPVELRYVSAVQLRCTDCTNYKAFSSLRKVYKVSSVQSPVHLRRFVHPFIQRVHGHGHGASASRGVPA